MRRLVKAWGFFVSIALLTAILFQQRSRAENPGEAGPCQIAVEAITQNDMAIDIYYPQGSCTTALDAPYPMIAYAHGFSFFGLSDGAGDNSGNGKHLASWGYIVAVPDLPDDAETRVEEIIQVLDFLAAANEDATSFLYGQVDPERFAVVGHSLGGATALAVAARDARIKAVVALDPVYHARTIVGGEYPVWYPALEGSAISVPVSILGATADACNSQADFEEIYPFVGSTHKASFILTNASHCVFADPGNSGCDLLCGGDKGPELTQLSQKYLTAWLNYYLREQPDDYDYIYGAGADSDIFAGTIRRTVSTSPRNSLANPFLRVPFRPAA
jgi:dienelactone hydrolase